MPGSVLLDGATVLGAATSPYSTLKLGGSLTLANGATFSPTASTRITLLLVGDKPQTLTGNGQDIVLAELDAVTNGGGAVLADAGGTTHLEVGSAAGGGYYLETGTTLRLNANSLRFMAGGKALIFGGQSAGSGQGTITPTGSSSINLENNGANATGTLRLAAGTTMVNNLRFSSANDLLSIPSDLTINGLLSLDNGALAMGDNTTLTLNGPVSTTGGYLQAAPTASLVIGGSGTLDKLTFKSKYQSINNLTLNRAASNLVLGSPLTVGGTLQLADGLLTTDATNLLSLGTAASVAGGSAGSFVNGPLARAVAEVSSPASFAFPVGKGGAYRPLTLNVATQTGTTVYRAEQLEGNPGQALSSPDPNGTALTRVSSFRAFTITPFNTAAPASITQPTGFSGTVTLGFEADDRVSDPAAPTLVVAKRADSSQPWANFGRSAYSGTAARGTLTSGTFTSFSDFALGSTDPATSPNPLPVSLVHFAAARTVSGVALAWTTASELRSHHFEVERSLDGQAFRQVASVAALGTSAQAHTYAAHDAAAPTGLLYYRLHQVDADGASAYSPTVAVADGPANELVISPNPTRDQLGYYSALPAAYLVRSVLGQVVRQGTTAAGLTQLDVQGLPSGVYFLELRTDAGRIVRRFVKE